MEPKKATKKRIRQRPLPPDVNSRNLAIEKRRRTEMNQKFLDLARCIPALATTTRPSKTVIVNESLQLLRQQRAMCIAAGRDLQNLLNANNNLVAEVNKLNAMLQVPSRLSPTRPTEAMVALMEVEKNVVGEFPDGIGSVRTPASSDGFRETQTPSQHHNATHQTGSLQGISGQDDDFRSNPTALLQQGLQTHDGHFSDSWPTQQTPPSLSLDPLHEGTVVQTEREQEDLQRLTDLVVFPSADAGTAELQGSIIMLDEQAHAVGHEQLLELSDHIGNGDIDFSPLGWNAAVEDLSGFWNDPLLQL